MKGEIIMGKKLLFSNSAREKILSGVEQLSNAVKVTLGPKGRNVVIEKLFGDPITTKDGVTVAKEVILEDQFENMGAQLIKQVAERTADNAGDGTTTATILAEAIYKEGLKNVTAGANPMSLKRGIEKAVQAVVSDIQKNSKPIDAENFKEVQQVAQIASNNDEIIGTKIAEAIKKVGKEGVITVEESKYLETELRMVEGMQFDNGYLSPYFCTNKEKMDCELENPFILLFEKQIGNVKAILPILEKVAKSGRPLMVICESVEGEVLATLIINTVKKMLPSVAIKAPFIGNRRKDMLEDIAILTGGTLVSEELGMKLENITLKDLGSAKKVQVTKDSTTILEGVGNQEEIKSRIENIKNQIEETDSDYDKEKLQERLAKLSGGIAILSVGAATEAEMKEKKARVEDALHATRAAVEEGIVPGGGVALLSAQKAVESLLRPLDGSPEHDLPDDVKTGCLIVRRALEEPLRQLCSNAGLEGSMVIKEISNKHDLYLGYDINKDKYVNMFESGVIDPAKVVREAIQNAGSIAGLLLITETLISIIPKKEE